MKKPKSFRFNEEDVKKLIQVHKYYKTEYIARTKASNMDDLYTWSEAQTLAVLIRDRYEELIEKGEIEN